MRVEISMTVRGGPRRLEWQDGVLSGDDEMISRLQRLVDAGRIDVDDLLTVVRGTELVTAQRVGVVNLDLTEPDLTEPDRLDLTEADGPSRPVPGAAGAVTAAASEADR